MVKTNTNKTNDECITKLNQSSIIPITDIAKSQQEQESIEHILNVVGDGLDHASKVLDDLERDGMLGPAIRRYASDLALVVGNVARDIDCGEDNDKSSQNNKKWARAIIEDAQNQLALEDNIRLDKNCNMVVSQDQKSAAGLVVELNEDEIIDAMKAAKSILLDIEDALMDISVDDAEEIADVGLVVAKMFLWGLQNIQNQVVLTMIKNADESLPSSIQRNSNDDGLVIEVLEEGGEDSENQTNSSTKRKSKLKDNKMRVLWPPIGPAVVSVASWGKNEAVKNPILSIALGMALWPTAVVVAFIGTPILTIDYVLQSGYNLMEDQPLIKNLERSAANVCQVAKLYFLVSKLMVKQSVRVGKRQIERRGGINKVVEDLGHWTIDRVMHPVESAGMAWNTFNAGIGVVSEALSAIKDVAISDVDHVDL